MYSTKIFSKVIKNTKMAKYKLNIKEFILIQIKYMLKVIKYNIKT